MDLVAYGLLAFGSLFAILSPFATVPMFLAFAEEDESEARVSMAWRACLIALIVLLGFGLPMRLRRTRRLRGTPVGPGVVGSREVSYISNPSAVGAQKPSPRGRSQEPGSFAQ